MTKLGGKWYSALEEIEIEVSEQRRFLEAGAILVAEYVFIDEEPVQEEVQEPEVQEEVVEEPMAEEPKVKEEPKKPTPKKNTKKK